MNHRLKLGLGLGLALAVALVLALVLLRPDQQRQQQSSRESGPSEQAPATPRSVGPSSPPSATPETDPRPDAVLAPTGEQRDATGELLSDGPAKVAELPERPPEALANTPDAETSAAARAETIARLDDDIAAARQAGDAAEVERLEVRKARLERKQTEGDAGEAAP